MWPDDALCRTFPDLPWIEEPHDRSPAAERSMALVCSICPVRTDCEEYADALAVTSGYWAGRDRTPEVELRSDGAA